MTSEAPSPADLAIDTEVHRLEPAPGWYTASLSSHWNYFTPSGGVLMTVALRAMRAELDDPSLRLLSATTLFCSPVPHGALEIRVDVLRRGGNAAQLRAALSSTELPGPGLEVTATFGRDRRGPTCAGAEFPDLPGPEECILLGERTGDNPHMRWPFFTNFDFRLAQGAKWWEPGWQAGPPRYARWFRYLSPQVTSDGHLDRVAIPPIADTMPAALLNGLGPERPRLLCPSLDLTIHFLEDSSSEWYLVSAYTRRARVGYATAEAEIWSADRRLVAYACQTMILKALPDRVE